MATYANQGGQVVLILTAAEARALRDAALYGEEARGDHDIPRPTRAACDAACRALASACAAL